MNIAIIGNGGREHAICQKLKDSKKIKNIFCIPGNAGTSEIAINLNIPMVFLGENAAYEYSGENNLDEKRMSQKWFNHYASNSGLSPKKFAKIYNIPYKRGDQFLYVCCCCQFAS